MTARTNRTDDLEVIRPDVIVVSEAPSLSGAPTPRVSDEGPGRQVPALEQQPTTSRRGRRLSSIALAAALIVAAAVAGSLLLTRGETEVATVPAAQPPVADAPSAAGDLRMTVEPPAAVVAGKPASFIVNYQGAGVFSGSSEEWGDQLGVSSVTPGRCDAATAADKPLKGRYTVAHTWAAPGTYIVVLGVHAYTCVGSQIREAQATRTLSVDVAP